MSTDGGVSGGAPATGTSGGCEGGGAHAMYRPPAPPAVAPQTTQAVGVPVKIPMDRSLAAPAVATPTASLPTISVATAVPMTSAVGAWAQQQARRVARASLL